MVVSGKEVAQKILEELKQGILEKNLHPALAIILAGNDPSSQVYVNNKVRAGVETGITVSVFNFKENEKEKCLRKIVHLSKNGNVDGIIVQYPVYNSWNFDEISGKVSLGKDVDGFLENSPFNGATALGVWEMLKRFAEIEELSIEDFLNGKKIIMIGKGRAAGKPTIRLLRDKGFNPIIVDSKTQDADQVIKSGDIIIAATGRKHIVNQSNIKNGAYVIGVGVGKEEGQTYGDIDEESVAKKAKLYCPTIGGIGPLTVACLLKNVVQSALKVRN